MILASSPPNSITISVSGKYFSTARLQDITSCINGIFKKLAADMAPEPVRAIVYVASG